MKTNSCASMYRSCVYFMLLLSLASCGAFRTHIDGNAVQRNVCLQSGLRENYYTINEALPEEAVEQDTLLAKRFSEKALHTANASGIIPLLRRYARAEALITDDDTTINYLRYMAIRQELNQKISLASLDVASIAAEVECERERSRGLAEYMSNQQSTRRQRYTLAALALGAAVTISSGIVDMSSESNADDIISISGGVVEAVLSLLSSTYKPIASFRHSPNLLEEIWNNPENSELYPPFVWKMLHLQQREKEDDTATPRIESLVKGWKEANYFTEEEKEEDVEKATQLLFGKGGEYTIGKLEARGEMLDQLQAAIGLIEQDLNALLREIDQQKRDRD